MSRCRSTPGHDPPAVPGPSPTVASCRQQVPSCGLCSTRIGGLPPHPHHFRRFGQARFPASRDRDLHFGWEVDQHRSASHHHPGRPFAPPSEALSAGAHAATNVPTDVRHHSRRDVGAGCREDIRRIGTRNARSARPALCDEKNTRPTRTYCLLRERSEPRQPPSKPIQPAYLNRQDVATRGLDEARAGRFLDGDGGQNDPRRIAPGVHSAMTVVTSGFLRLNIPS